MSSSSPVTRTKKWGPWAIVVIVVVGLATALAIGFGRPFPFMKSRLPLEKLRIAVCPIPMSAPIWIALDQGYFKEEGLDVSLETFVSGKDALGAALAGKADVATVGETPIMLTVMAGGTVSVLATICDSETVTAIVARRDRGISKPGDLEGKTIGVTPGTTSQYLLNTFLLYHGVPEESAKTVPLRPDEMKDALINGRIDAASTWEPQLSEIERTLGPKAQIYYATGFYRSTWNLAARPDFVAGRADAVKKMLRAVIKAERFMREKPAQTLMVVAERSGLNKEELSKTWSSNYFRVALDQSLVVTLENQAHWAIARKIVPGPAVPNFLESIYTDGLKSVRPDGVTIGGSR